MSLNLSKLEALPESEIENYLSEFSKDELDAIQTLVEGKSFADLKHVSDSIYKVPCPTPEEFLDKWISPGISKGIFPHIRESFIEIWSYEKKYNDVVLYGATRWGKSVLSRLSIVYCIVFLWCLKNPHEFFNINEMSALAIFLLCFSKKKAMSLILDPIFTILRSSPKFHQVKLLDSLVPTQKKLGNSKIAWTTADKSGEAVFSGNIHIHLGSSPLDIIGADIIFAVVSEINFFKESVGVSEEDVWGVYIDLKDRIKGTIGEKYGSMLFLDSSANDRDSIIEKYILEEACKQKNTYYLHLSRWAAVPKLYPKWEATKETFRVFTGDAQREAAIVNDSFGYKTKDESKYIDVPIDAYDSFKEDIIKAIRNQAGLPQGAANRFFPDLEVLDGMWDSNLFGVTKPLEAPMKSNPKHLIYNLVKELLFDEVQHGVRFKRAPNAQRWGRLDLSETSDRVGLGLMHAEITNMGEILAISDLLVDFRPTKVGFNLEAALQFFLELKNGRRVLQKPAPPEEACSALQNTSSER